MNAFGVPAEGYLPATLITVRDHRTGRVTPPGGRRREVALIRCPVCDSPRVVIVLSPERKAFCVKCSSRWIQEGSLQRAVHSADRKGVAVTAPTVTEPTV